MSAQTDTPVAENIQAALLARLETLSPERQRQVLDFAEFLSEREEKAANGGATTKSVHRDKVRTRQPGEDWPDTERIAEHQWLKEHGAQYAGQWVALKGDRLISHGADAKQVFAQVEQDGAASPFVTYIEGPDDLPFGGW
jgi:hypothetical protein